MKHPFQVLRSEYAGLLATAQITRTKEALHEAQILLRPENLSRYLAVSEKLAIPAALIAALDMRESSANPARALGQGDPWNQVSTHEPKGFGPFKSWAAAAEFYLHREKFDQATAVWDMAYSCWKGEGWNGLGPRDHGIHTGYLWAGTNHYTRGKYVADGKWNPSTVDQQLGIVPVILTMASLDPSLAITAASPVPARPIIAPLPVPVGMSDAEWTQWALNKVSNAGLVVDGSYGRLTRSAVRAFQSAHGLEDDGLAGPLTLAALRLAVENIK